jgi:hypothetical protein
MRTNLQVEYPSRRLSLATRSLLQIIVAQETTGPMLVVRPSKLQGLTELTSIEPSVEGF